MNDPDTHPIGPRSGTQAIDRALSVLLCFEGSSALGVSEVARQTGLATSTAHRVLRALARGGILAQDAATGAYQLGPGAAVLGELAGERLGFASTLPKLQALAYQTGAAVSLGVRDGRESLIVVQVPSPMPGGLAAHVGIRSPVHACALGKVLLAFDSSLTPASDPLSAVTSHTITDRVALREELERVRDRGWSVSDEELALGVRSVASPVFDPAGWVSAAVGVGAPSEKLARTDLDGIAAAVRATADALRGTIPRLSFG